MKILLIYIPNNITNSVTVFEQLQLIENSRKIKQITWGDQHAKKTNPAMTRIFANRLRLRSVDVWGIGSSAGGQGGDGSFALACWFWSLLIDLWSNKKINFVEIFDSIERIKKLFNYGKVFFMASCCSPTSLTLSSAIS